MNILDEEVFGTVLARERKRSDRSKRGFGLVLLSMKGEAKGDAVLLWDVAIDALAAAKREGDVAGWLNSRAIGIVLPEDGTSEVVEICDEFEGLLREELSNRLGAGRICRFSIERHVYPESRRGEHGLWPIDPRFYPDLHPQGVPASWFEAIKRSVDVFGSLTLLVVFAPLLLLIAGLVKVGSRGPVIFRQERVGRMMKPFTMLKFRTMFSDSDQRVHHEFVSSFIRASGQVDEPDKRGVFKLTDDPRITSVGQVLRRTSLDELPQLWNVLRGDMSLVGPRPPLPYELDEYETWHRRRVLEAKPGVTGLWQVVGRSRTTFDEMVRLDLRYAKTRSLWTDIKILIATPRAVISGKGAC